MPRYLFPLVIGFLVGISAAALLLWVTSVILAWQTAPLRHQIEHGVIYHSVVLGAGFGALTGAVIGVARVARYNNP